MRQPLRPLLAFALLACAATVTAYGQTLSVSDPPGTALTTLPTTPPPSTPDDAPNLRGIPVSPQVFLEAMQGMEQPRVTTAPATPDPTPVPDPAAAAADRAIDDQIARLEQAPGIKEAFDLQKKVNEIDTRDNKERAALDEAITKLEDTDTYRQFEQNARDLEAKRNNGWEIERKKMAAIAAEIYQARHAELLKLAPRDLPGARALGFDVLSYPRVDGSTSTQPLAVILASRILGIPYKWAYPEPTGYPWVERAQLPGPVTLPGSFFYDASYNPELSIVASRAYAFGDSPRDQRVAAMTNSLLAANSNTHDAYVHVINGDCDINLTARSPSADETKLAHDKKVELELVPIATDALVFIVHRDNPVKSLTLEQLKSIYALQTTQWQNVGGANMEIHPFLRELNSGSRELFDTLLTKTPTDEKYARATSELYAGSMSGPYNRVTQQPEGLGYSVYYYEHFMALSPFTRNLAINGIEPNAETLANGKYPLCAPVYAVVRKTDPANAPGRKLVNYLTSPEGRQLIRETGYVPTDKPQ